MLRICLAQHGLDKLAGVERELCSWDVSAVPSVANRIFSQLL